MRPESKPCRMNNSEPVQDSSQLSLALLENFLCTGSLSRVSEEPCLAFVVTMKSKDRVKIIDSELLHDKNSVVNLFF